MARPLRVGYIVKRFPRVSETFIAQEVLELERRGAEVRIFALSHGDGPVGHAWLSRLRAPVNVIDNAFADAWNDLVLVYARADRRRRAARAVLASLAQTPDRARRFLREAVAVAQACEREQIDHLHAHFADHPAVVAMLAHHLTGTPYSFTAHAKDIWANQADASHWRRLLRHASFAATVSDASRRHLAGIAGPRLAGRVRHLFNGVDLDGIRPAPTEAAPRQPPRLLCVARLVEKKGVDVLLDACAILLGRGRRFALTIIGDGPLAEPLRERSARLGIGDQVRFVGAAAHEAVVETMRDSTLFVLPCRVAADGDQDNLPTVLLEAMGCGLPCVSAPVGGVAEIIDDGVTGKLVAVDDPAALAACMHELLGDADMLRRMGAAGRKRAERLFHRANTVARLHEWMETAVAVDASRAAGGDRR